MRILTYNIHHWDGRDGRADIERLAAVISQSGADLVSLNEVVHPVRRRGHLEFPLVDLARAVGMNWSFGSSTRHIEGTDWRGPVGNAILSRHPIRDFNNHLLPRLPGTQQRSVLLAHIAVKGYQHAFTFGVTHLDHALEAVRLWQIRGLLREARDFSFRISIGADAHNLAGIANVPFGVGIARKGWLTRADVLNTLPVEGFLAHVTARRARA